MQREQGRETERQGEQPEGRETRIGSQEGMRQIERHSEVGRQEGEHSMKGGEQMLLGEKNRRIQAIR